MSHLGDDAAALVDDQLVGERRERALAHLARCATCREDVDMQRRLKAALRAERAASPEAFRELIAQTLALVAPARPEAAAHHHPARSFVRPGRVVAVAVTAAAGFAGVVALGSGSASPGGPAVTPPVSSYTLDTAVTTREVPFTDPGAAAAVPVVLRSP